MCNMSLTNQVFKGVFFLSGGWVDHVQYLRVDMCNMSLTNQVFKGVFFLSDGWVDHVQYLR